MNDLPHGVYYVTRDGTRYHLDSSGDDPAPRLAADVPEAAVALALIFVAKDRLQRAQHIAATPKPKPNS